MRACGKGSYGRLGLGDSGGQSEPQTLGSFSLQTGLKVVQMRTSRGSDGHTLGIAIAGSVRFAFSF